MGNPIFGRKNLLIVYQKKQNSNIWGGMFPKKSYFCQYIHEIIMILDFWDYNGAPL